MPKFVEFKKEIKATQSVDRGVLKIIEEEIREVRKRFTKQCVTSPEFFEIHFPYLYKQLQILVLEKKLSSGGSAIAKGKVLINVDGELKSFEEINEQLTFDNFSGLPENTQSVYNKEKQDISYVCIDLNTDLEQVLSNIRRTYSVNQEIINAMDNEKIINYIDLERLLSHLVTSKLSPVDTLEILGVAVGFDVKYLENHPNADLPNTLFVSKLSDYFNIDGTLKLNEDIAQFRIILIEILEKFMFSYKMFSEIGLVDTNFNISGLIQISKILCEYCELIVANNERLKKLVINEKSINEAVILETKLTVDRKYLDELRKYYRNNEIVCIPEDMNMFMELLKNCELDEREQKYILSLISELKENDEDKELQYLNPSEKMIYERALSILNGLHYSDSDYYVLVQLIDDLKAALNILCETESEEDKEYLKVEISELIAKIEEVVSKYSKSVISENTILFLLDENMVPYVRKDSDLLDGSFYKMVCNGIRKIRKDNQSNFRLVMTNDNISYRVYDILSSKIHLSFIEVDSGIYVLIGCDVASHGYEDIVKRAIYHESEIKELERLVKDENTRNSVLTSHEQYFELFNKDDRDMTKKRTN